MLTDVYLSLPGHVQISYHPPEGVGHRYEKGMKWVGGNTIQREAPVPTHRIQYFPKASFLSSGHLGKCLRHADEMMNSNKGAVQVVI